MANKIKLTRGTKANIEANKSSLESYQIVYATDTSEIGVKKANGNVDYFPDTARLENMASKLYGADNLAVPDLEGKEYLGDGVYRLYDGNGVTIDYNVFNGIFTYNGTSSAGWQHTLFNIEQNTEYTLSYIAVSGTLTGGRLNIIISSPNTNVLFQNNENVNKQSTFITTTQDILRTDFSDGRIFNNYQFKLQLEKGSTATPYTVPAPFLLPNDIPEWAKTEPPSAVRYMKMNANNTVTWRTAAQLRGDIGAATPANITDAISNHDDSDTAHQDIRTSLSKKLPQEVIFGANDKPETTIRVTNIRNDQNTVQAIHIHDSGDITLGGPFGEYPNTIISKAKLGYDPSDPSDVVDKYYVDSKTMKLINSGSSTALSKTTYRTFTVPSDSYAGKTVAVEIKYGSSSSTTYTNKVIYVTLGTNTSTEASKTYPRFITLSEWDGEYLKHISVKAYVSSGTTSSINFGYVKTLIGRFTGSTIDWTTQANDNINVYIGKIWLVG